MKNTNQQKIFNILKYPEKGMVCVDMQFFKRRILYLHKILMSYLTFKPSKWCLGGDVLC